ncbi:DNA topoisomerase IB [Winogradskyella maritima]|uniref:DNA topoisomerase n=1 Tax=Winogradskyella maritima TaxID=1517766 RepID=A0ABV8AKD2_9FLAO|nr:DNA topoisomerase IB [Winogradskyella maritima]
MNTEAINLDVVKQLYKEPQDMVDSFDLIYTSDDLLTVTRERKGKSFVYRHSGRKISSKKILDRINQLVIPPNWTDVRIAYDERAHLQAVGRDAKNRKQYRYHPRWNALRNKTKFFKMSAFGAKLPKIRAQVDKDLALKEWTQRKTLALVVRLMEETHIRIGNEQYAKRNKTYGLTTMRTKHVNLFKNKLKFEFVGKRGKAHSITLKNKKLIRLVNQCEEIPGWELFKFYDEKGTKQTIESSMVNQYIHDLTGQLFTAKDYRTWGASIIAFETLKFLGIPKDEKTIDKNLLAAVDEARQALGNTRTVLRKYYLHPHIVNSYKDGSIASAFNIADSIENDPYFSASEKAMLQLIKAYHPKI